MRDFLSYFGVFVAGAVLFFGVLVGGVGVVAYQVDKRGCYEFGAQANREVKFVRYTLVTWGCLTPTADGKWIEVGLLREVPR